ncbi:MAG: DedA family protein [Limnochordales bacterium]|nr:YqaA family protein [Limnochordales bacterium]
MTPADVRLWLEQFILVLHPANLFVLSFIEAIFFPIPPDALLIPMVLVKPQAGLWYATITTTASVLGASVGYWLGLRGGRPLLLRYFHGPTAEKVEALFHRYDTWAIAMAGFTPIPYKVFAVGAGVFGLHFRRFLVASVLSRGARFYLVSLVVMLFGEQLAQLIIDHFGLLTLLIFAVAAAGYFLARRRSQA